LEDAQASRFINIREAKLKSILKVDFGKSQAMALNAEGDSEVIALRNKIVLRAQGVFLWVRLVTDKVVEGLREGDSIQEMDKLLDDIPTELSDLFFRAIMKNRRTSSSKACQTRLEIYIIF
jgi:hypothetical protein